MKTISAHPIRTIIIACLAALNIGKAFSGVGATVPVSADLGTSIAQNLFPVTVQLNKGYLFLTSPKILFIDLTRTGIEARFQAYDHRPAEGIAISENGTTMISGKLGYDRSARKILIYEPMLEKLEFERDNAVTRRLARDIQRAWSVQISSPIESALPPHPYILPFENNIHDLSYDGQTINLELEYE